MVRAVQTTEGLLRGMGQPDREFDRVDAIMERQVPSWRGRMIVRGVDPRDNAVGSR